MRKFASILVIMTAVFLFSCSEKDSEPAGMDIDFDRYGVAKWDNPEDFIVKRYYTKVDTFTVKGPDLSVIVKILDSETVTGVRWWIEGVWFDSSHVDEISNAANGLTIRTFYPKFGEPYDYADNTRVTAYITVGKNKIERKETVTELRFDCDIFGVDFGIDSLAVRFMLEQTHGVSRFHMRDEEIGVDYISPHFLNSGNGRSLYIFPAGNNYELSEVAEFPSMIWKVPDNDSRSEATWQLSDDFLALCRKLECPYDIEINDDATLAREDYCWSRDQIEYRIISRSDVFPASPDLTDEGENGRIISPIGDDKSPDNPALYLQNSIGISYKPSTVPEI